MFSYRDRTPNLFDFAAVPLLPAVNSFLPSHLACSACRLATSAGVAIGGNTMLLIGGALLLVLVMSRR